MYEMTSYCGVECDMCPAYAATQANDMEQLSRVASEWSKAFGMEILKESIICDGCKSDTGRICSYCAICRVRQCAQGKDLPTCAHCEEYVCGILETCPSFAATKENLERIRRGL